MKIFFLFILSLFALKINAQTTYYLSNTGNDGNSGTSSASPWQTISKLNTATLNPGDIIAFKGGDTFTGTIVLSNSGNSTNPITYTSYGTGKAILSGLTTLSTWTTYNTNIQKAALSSGGHLEVVTVDSVPVGRGRYPNTGFFHYQSFVEDASITDTTLPTSPSWSGAEIVMRKSAWTLDRDSITSQSSHTLNFTAGSTWETMSNNWGYFIQNSLQACDTLHEWYYDGTYLYMYFGGTSPSSYTIKAATTDNLLTGSSKNYIKVKNLIFEGSDNSAIDITSCTHFTVDSCDFKTIGLNGIFDETGCSYLTVTNTTFNNIYSMSITMGTNSDYAYIAYNTISNTNIIKGTGEHGSGANWDNVGDGLDLGTNNNHITVEYNNFSYIGHSGLRFGGQYDTIRNNYIQHIGQTRMDAGAIYVWNNSTQPVGSDIQKNIIVYTDVDTTGNPKGDEFYGNSGVYLDYVSDISVLNNTIDSTQGYGIYLNGGDSIEIHDNNVFNSTGSALSLTESSLGQESYLNITRNNFVAKNLPVNYYSLPYSNQGVNSATLKFLSNDSSWNNIGTLDSNYYARPIDDNITINTKLAGDANWYGVKRDLASWQSFTGQDSHSHKSPREVATTNDILFYYNPTNSDSTVILSSTYEDLAGTHYDTVTIAPFESIVLIKTTSFAIAMSSDQSINDVSTTVYVTVTFDVGHSGTYSWVKTSGPSASISDPTNSTTIVSGLTDGTYIFECTVTQDDSQVLVGDVTVVVSGQKVTQIWYNPVRNKIQQN